MNTIRIVVSVLPGTLDAALLNEELSSISTSFIGSHNATEAIVSCDPSEEAAIRAAIDAHIAAAPKRERNKKRIAKIARLEEKQTLRRMREAVKGDSTALAFLADLDDQIAAERATLES